MNFILLFMILVISLIDIMGIISIFAELKRWNDLREEALKKLMEAKHEVNG